ncbi:MAG: SRPBCC domain-containing protein [Actinomycetota bacterium]|nr:SRPBCC domain-containing protein [Actinomycetota bacterium]
MADFEIERDVVIEAPVDVVWRTITEPDQITRWFADLVELDLRPGGHGYLGFGEQKGTAILVEAVDRPSRFAFRWNRPQDKDPTVDNSVLVEFTLTARGPESTHLRVVETGVEVLAWPDEDKHSYTEDHNGGWTACFNRLAALFVEPTAG